MSNSWYLQDVKLKLLESKQSHGSLHVELVFDAKNKPQLKILAKSFYLSRLLVSESNGILQIKGDGISVTCKDSTGFMKAVTTMKSGKRAVDENSDNYSASTNVKFLKATPSRGLNLQKAPMRAPLMQETSFRPIHAIDKIIDKKADVTRSADVKRSREFLELQPISAPKIQKLAHGNLVPKISEVVVTTSESLYENSPAASEMKKRVPSPIPNPKRSPETGASAQKHNEKNDWLRDMTKKLGFSSVHEPIALRTYGKRDSGTDQKITPSSQKATARDIFDDDEEEDVDSRNNSPLRPSGLTSLATPKVNLSASSASSLTTSFLSSSSSPALQSKSNVTTMLQRLSTVQNTTTNSSLSSPSYSLEGFRNLGNSCYLNAILQALLKLDPFLTDLQSPFWTSLYTRPVQAIYDDAPSSLPIAHSGNIVPTGNSNTSVVLMKKSTCYTELMNIVKSSSRPNHGVQETTFFKKAIDAQTKRFFGYKQQDAHEFLIEFLRLLEEDMLQSAKQAVVGYLQEERINNTSFTKLRTKEFSSRTNIDPDCVTNAVWSAETISSCATDSPDVSYEKATEPSIARGPKCVWSSFSSHLLAMLPTYRQFESIVHLKGVCILCGKEKELVTERYRDFSLDLHSSPSWLSEETRLEDLMSRFLGPDEREADCPICQSSNAKIRVVGRVAKLSNVLIFHLKRFKFDLSDGNCQKVFTKVKFPATLDVKPFLRSNEDIPTSIKVETSMEAQHFVNNHPAADTTSATESTNVHFVQYIQHQLGRMQGEATLKQSFKKEIAKSANEGVQNSCNEMISNHEGSPKNSVPSIPNAVGTSALLFSPTVSGARVPEVVSSPSEFEFPWHPTVPLLVEDQMSPLDVPLRLSQYIENRRYAVSEAGPNTLHTSNVALHASYSRLTQGSEQDSDLSYRLVAVVRHLGNDLFGGHYICDASTALPQVKAPSDASPDGLGYGARLWRRYDDAKVRIISEEYVLQDKETPYILFYAKI